MRHNDNTAALEWTRLLPPGWQMVWQHEEWGEDEPLRLAAVGASGVGNVQIIRNLAGKPLAADANGNLLPFHISNSHDGGSHIAIAIPAAGFAGVGIDIVYLPRLGSMRHTRQYLYRLASRVMDNIEHHEFVSLCDGLDLCDVRLQFAARFSLMESASKALGTGLRLGVGFGRPTSLHPHQLSAVFQHNAWNMRTGLDARDRMMGLGGRKFECYCGTSHDYLVSCVLVAC